MRSGVEIYTVGSDPGSKLADFETFKILDMGLESTPSV